MRICLARPGPGTFGQHSQVDAFAEFKEAKKADRQEQIDFVVNNSKMGESDIAEMSDGALQSLVNSIKPKNTHIVNGKVEEPKFIPLEDA